jgi:RNA helicase HrpA
MSSASELPGSQPVYRFAYPELPVSERREEIAAALAKHRVLIVEGGTGSGKSTQLPKILLESGLVQRGILGVTQPRRLAALALTDRLREETDQADLFGSQIRFQEDMPKAAKVKVMTDGVLLQEYRRDPLLRRYDAVILDEAHERSLNIDILLGVGLSICRRRPEFKWVVASATLDAERFQAYYRDVPGGAGLLRVEGRQFPVTIEYRDPGLAWADDDDETAQRPGKEGLSPIEAASLAIGDLMQMRPDDMLCFLPTEKEINELARELEKDWGHRAVILPLYGRLAPSDQRRVYQRHGKPKIVLATNIAETSLTIPGIAYVVDTGTARISRYHPQTRIQGLPIEKIAQASASQRSGRAGRVKPGLCIRLYSREDFESRPLWPEPEILRGNLTNVVLQLLSLSLPVLDFPFLDPPTPAALKGAYRRLQELGAVVDEGETMRLTDTGWRMSRLPVDAGLAKILLAAQEYGVLAPAMVVAAGLTVQDPRITPSEEPERGKAVGLHRRFEDARSDFTGILKLWAWLQREWRDGFSQRRLRKLCVDNFLSYLRIREWMDLTDQFGRLLPGGGSAYEIDFSKFDSDALHKAILSGFLAHLARRRVDEPTYRLIGDKEAVIHSGSGLAKRRPEWIVAGEVRQTSRTFIQRACEIKPAWVEEVAPDAVKKSYADIAWNPERGFVEATERVTYRNFVLRQDRRVDYARVDPTACAVLFWQEAVLRQQNAGDFEFIRKNQEVLAQLEKHEGQSRRRDWAPEEDALLHFYLERAPEVHSRVSLKRFVEASPAQAQSLFFKKEDFLSKDAWREWKDWETCLLPTTGPKLARAADSPWEAIFPETLAFPSGEARVQYHFDFGQEMDGISIEAPLAALNHFSPSRIWQCLPGWRIYLWTHVLEKLSPKDAEKADLKKPGFFRAWQEALAESTAWSLKTPALAFSQTAAAHFPDFPQMQPTWPVSWPQHLKVRLYLTSMNGRRHLMVIDPGTCDAEWALVAAQSLYGSPATTQPAPQTLQTFRQTWGEWPPELTCLGLRWAATLWVSPAPPPNPSASQGFHWKADGMVTGWSNALARIQAQESETQLGLWDKNKKCSAFFLRRFDALTGALRLPLDAMAAVKPWVERLCHQEIPNRLARLGPWEEQSSEWERKWPLPKAHFKHSASAKSFKDLQSASQAQDATAGLTTMGLLLAAATVSWDDFQRALSWSDPTHENDAPATWKKTAQLLEGWLKTTPTAQRYASRWPWLTAIPLAFAWPQNGYAWRKEPWTFESWTAAFQTSPASPLDGRYKNNKQRCEAMRQDLKQWQLLPQQWPQGYSDRLDRVAGGAEDGLIELQLAAYGAREALKRCGKKGPAAFTSSEPAANKDSLKGLQSRFKKL